MSFANVCLASRLNSKVSRAKNREASKATHHPVLLLLLDPEIGAVLKRGWPLASVTTTVAIRTYGPVGVSCRTLDCMGCMGWIVAVPLIERSCIGRSTTSVMCLSHSQYIYSRPMSTGHISVIEYYIVYRYSIV